MTSPSESAPIGGRPRALIAGGGVAGLSAALALKRAGVAVKVFERTHPSPAIGAGLQIWFNGVLACDRLGVGDQLRAAGTPLEGQRFVSAHGKPLAEIDFGPVADRLGIPRPVSVGRRALLTLLADAVGADLIEYGANCTGWTQQDSQASLQIDGSREEVGEVLILADGLNSKLRSPLVPARRVYAGYQYLRAVIDDHDDVQMPPDRLYVAFGRGTRLGTVAMGDRRALFGSFPAPEGMTDPPAGRKADFLHQFRGFARSILNLIASIPEGATIARTDIADIDPLSRWSEGRVVLTGDAAHATTPNQGRGASEAIEDAVFLADRLSSADLHRADDVARALRSFEDQRRHPTATVQTGSRRAGKLIKMHNPVACWLRNEIAIKRVLPARIVRGIEREFGDTEAAYKPPTEVRMGSANRPPDG